MNTDEFPCAVVSAFQLLTSPLIPSSSFLSSLQTMAASFITSQLDRIRLSSSCFLANTRQRALIVSSCSGLGIALAVLVVVASAFACTISGLVLSIRVPAFSLSRFRDTHSYWYSLSLALVVE